MQPLTVEVAGPGDVVDPPAAIGVPVLAGAAGPELVPVPQLVSPGLAGLVLPGGLDPAVCTRRRFAGKAGQVLQVGGGLADPLVLLVGIGAGVAGDAEGWRRAAASLVRGAGDGGTAVLVAPGDLHGLPAVAVGAAVAEGAMLGAYRFDAFRSAPRPGSVDRLIVVAADEADRADLAAGVRRGAVGARATAWARDLINTPPGDLPPVQMADQVSAALAGIEGVRLEVWDEGRIAAERLGGVMGVSRGSSQPPRLVRATYEPAVPDPGHLPHVVLVGKGITFDSGGLSLKSADGMTTMKTDMSGAAIVLAALSACAELRLQARVTALAPMAENMPGGRAIKPGDVLTARNGATIEVLNTDAEGRLVLADALCLAAELDADAVVDVATLTGAATVALGRSIAALFGNDDALVERVRQAGERAGERLWPMPLPDEYADHIDSDVADMKNVGKAGQAGAIAAAMLLSRFVGASHWAHLDIAGTGRATESSGYLSQGGTGFGVRTLVELVSSFAGEGAGPAEVPEGEPAPGGPG